MGERNDNRRARVTALRAVSRKSKGKVHEATTRVGKRTVLCVRSVTQTEERREGKREGVRARVYVRPRAGVSDRVCNTEETRIRRAALANESTRESKLGH